MVQRMPSVQEISENLDQKMGKGVKIERKIVSLSVMVATVIVME